MRAHRSSLLARIGSGRLVAILAAGLFRVRTLCAGAVPGRDCPPQTVLLADEAARRQHLLAFSDANLVKLGLDMAEIE